MHAVQWQKNKRHEYAEGVFLMDDKTWPLRALVAAGPEYPRSRLHSVAWIGIVQGRGLGFGLETLRAGMLQPGNQLRHVLVYRGCIQKASPPIYLPCGIDCNSNEWPDVAQPPKPFNGNLSVRLDCVLCATAALQTPAVLWGSSFLTWTGSLVRRGLVMKGRSSFDD
jgi:hypothetical protein